MGDGLTVGVLEPDLDEAVEGLAGDEGPVGDGVVGLAGVVPGRGLGAGRRGLEGLRGGGERGARKGESGAEEEEDAGELHRGRRERRRGAGTTGAGGSEKDSRSQKRGRRVVLWSRTEAGPWWIPAGPSVVHRDRQVCGWRGR